MTDPDVDSRPLPEPIGTVEILRTRIYPLDPEAAGHPLATSVVVRPGTYPVYCDVMATYWVMTGRSNGRGATKIGAGIFTLDRSDLASGPEMTFPSGRYGPDQLTDLLAEPMCTDGHPEQRLRFSLPAAGA